MIGQQRLNFQSLTITRALKGHLDIIVDGDQVLPSQMDLDEV